MEKISVQSLQGIQWWTRSRVFVAAGVGLFTALTVWREFREAQPNPVLYGKGYVNVELANEFEFPKYEIKFGNSQGPMLLQEIYVTDNQKKKIPVEEAFANFKSAALTSSSLFVEHPEPGRRWNTVGIIPIATFRPKKDVDTSNDVWFNEFIDEMQKRELTLNVRYSWLHSITRFPSVYSTSIPPK